MKQIMKVVQQGQVLTVPSQKAEGGQTQLCTIVLQELGGRYEDEYVAHMFGNMAQCLFQPGDVVAVALRFAKREYGGQWYQDVVVNEIVKV